MKNMFNLDDPDQNIDLSILRDTIIVIVILCIVIFGIITYSNIRGAQFEIVQEVYEDYESNYQIHTRVQTKDKTRIMFRSSVDILALDKRSLALKRLEFEKAETFLNRFEFVKDSLEKVEEQREQLIEDFNNQDCKNVDLSILFEITDTITTDTIKDTLGSAMIILEYNEK